MMVAVLLTMAGTAAKAQDGVAWSETVAELNALGLQVEVQPPGATLGTPVMEVAPPAALASGEVLGGARVQVMDYVRTTLSNVFRRNTERLIDDAMEEIGQACEMILGSTEEVGLVVSVGLSLGIITVTFTPTREFCLTASQR